MAILSDLRRGRTLYHTKAGNQRCPHTKKRARIYSRVFVLQVDEVAQKALASMNGAPAEWFVKQAWAKWKTTPPEDLIIKDRTILTKTEIQG
jgi:hypothetical protein